MHKGKYKYGKYIVGSGSAAETLVKWVASGDFETFEKEQFCFGHRGRLRNRVYSFHLPEIRRQVIMKVFYIDPEYILSRRLHLLFNLYFKDYNKAAFKGCHASHQSNLPVAKPLAYWNLRRDFLHPKSYFLYEKIEGCLLRDLFDKIQQQDRDTSRLLDAIRLKAINTLREFHDANVNHDDFHMRNILVNAPIDRLEPDDVENVTFHLIDYDHCRKAKIRIPVIKKFFDVKDFKRMGIAETDSHEMLDLYLRRRMLLWHGVLEFWKRGGFNLLRWFRQRRAHERGRHRRK